MDDLKNAAHLQRIRENNLRLFLKIRLGLLSWDPRGRSSEFRRSLRNAVYNSLDYAIVPILWLVATPIFISGLGLDQFGVLLLVFTLMGFGGVMAFGIGPATVKFVSGYHARNDLAGLERTICSSITIAALLGFITSAVLFFLAPFLAENLFKIDEKNVALTTAAFQIAGVGIAASYLDNVFQSVFHGFHRYDLAARVSIVTNASTIAVNGCLVLAGFGLVEIIWMRVFFTVASVLVKVILIRRALKWRGALRPTFSPVALREIFSFGFFIWLQSLGSYFLSHLDRFLVASMLGTTPLAYYAVCIQLAQQIHILPARAMSFVYPMASSVNEMGDTERLRRIYFSGVSLVSVAAVALGAPMFVFSEAILEFWVGPEISANGANLLRVLVVAFSILATSIVPSYFLNGTGYVRLATGLSLVSGAIVGSLAFVLIPLIGILGGAMSRLANMPFVLIALAIIHYRVLNDRRWYVGVLIYFPILIPYIIGSMVLWIFGAPKLGLLALILGVGAVAVLGAATTGVIALLCSRPKLPSTGEAKTITSWKDKEASRDISDRR